MSILREGNYLEQGKGYMQSDEITSRQSKPGSFNFNFKNPGSRPDSEPCWAAQQLSTGWHRASLRGAFGNCPHTVGKEQVKLFQT